jgi:hypothetical protein
MTYWADATSVQLAERLLRLAEEAAVLLGLAQRSERDHPPGGRELALREYPHLTRSWHPDCFPVMRSESSAALVGRDVLPEEPSASSAGQGAGHARPLHGRRVEENTRRRDPSDRREGAARAD